MLSYTNLMVVFTTLLVKQYACMQFYNNYDHVLKDTKKGNKILK